MYMSNYEKLVIELCNINKKDLAARIIKVEENHEYQEKRRIDYELYLLLLDLVPERIKDQIETLRLEIINMKKSIMDQSGWYVDNDIFEFSNGVFMHDFSYDMGYDVAYIVRNNKEYKVLDDFKTPSRERLETDFFETYKEQLIGLNDMICLYELLLRTCSKSVKNNKSLVNEIVTYLEYNDSKKKNKTYNY